MRPRQAAWLGPTGQQSAHYAKHATAARLEPNKRVRQSDVRKDIACRPDEALRPPRQPHDLLFALSASGSGLPKKPRQRHGGGAGALPRPLQANTAPRKQGMMGKQKGPHVAQPVRLHKLQHGVQEVAQ